MKGYPFLASKNVKHPSTLRFTLETDAIRDSNTRSWPFDDVLPSDWFSEYAFYFYSHGIVKGFGQKRELSPAPLGPGNNVNFAEFLKITLKAYYHVVGNASYSQCSEAPAPYPVFPLSSSEAGNWYCEYYNNELVQSALLKLNELTASVSRGSAGQYVKRKEAALLIQKIFDLPLLTSELSFSDISSEHSFYDWISSSRKYGIFNGYSDNSFGGEKEIMRSEMLKIIRFALSIKSKLEEE